MTDFPQWQKDSIKKLIHELDEIHDLQRRELLRRKLQRELEETHNSCMAHVQVVKKLEKRGISLIRRLNVVNNKVVEDV